MGDFFALGASAEWSSVSGIGGGSGCCGKLNSVIPFQSSENSRAEAESASDQVSLIQESRSGIPFKSSSKTSVVLSGPKSVSTGPCSGSFGNTIVFVECGGGMPSSWEAFPSDRECEGGQRGGLEWATCS